MKRPKNSKLLSKVTRLSSFSYVIECPKCGNYAASADDPAKLPDWVVCKECYPTRLINDVIRMDYRRRFCKDGSKDFLS